MAYPAAKIKHFILVLRLMPYAVRTLAQMKTVLSTHLWECSEIFPLHFFSNGICLAGINQCHATSLKASTAKASTVDTVGFPHDFIELDLLRRTGFPVMDTAPARFKG